MIGRMRKLGYKTFVERLHLLVRKLRKPRRLRPPAPLRIRFSTA
jgi:hypothetical protein